jgi:glucoselysine-6-phosphate deglycase
VGKGVSAKVALEDALKVLETLCYPAIGYEFEEFLHGPACCTDEGLVLFQFLAPGEDAARMLRAADIIGAATKNCYIVSHDPSVRGDKVLYLPTPDPVYLSPFTDILFGQLISAVLTQDMGRQRHPAVKDFYAKMGTKVPN